MSLSLRSGTLAAALALAAMTSIGAQPPEEAAAPPAPEMPAFQPPAIDPGQFVPPDGFAPPPVPEPAPAPVPEPVPSEPPPALPVEPPPLEPPPPPPSEPPAFEPPPPPVVESPVSEPPAPEFVPPSAPAAPPTPVDGPLVTEPPADVPQTDQIRISPSPAPTPAPEPTAPPAPESTSPPNYTEAPPAEILTPPDRTAGTSQIIVVPTQPQPVPVPVPVPAPVPAPVPYPIPTAGPLLITSFDSSGRIRAGATSAFYPVDASRPVARIEITWTDRGRFAMGHLLVNNESSSRWQPEQVDSPGTVAFVVNDRITGFRLHAQRDDIYLLQVNVTYGSGGGQPVSGRPYDEYLYMRNPLVIPRETRSALFPVDSRRLIDRIDICWGDGNRQRARGRLYFEGAHADSTDRRSVSREGEIESFTLRDTAAAFSIRSYTADLYIYWIRVYYATGAGSGPVCLFGGTGGRMLVPANGFSQVFTTPDPSRPVRSVRVVWSDRGGEARGRLFINGERTSRYGTRDVSSPGEARWTVNRSVQSFVIGIDRDPAWIEEVWVEY